MSVCMYVCMYVCNIVTVTSEKMSFQLEFCPKSRIFKLQSNYKLVGRPWKRAIKVRKKNTTAIQLQCHTQKLERR